MWVEGLHLSQMGLGLHPTAVWLCNLGTSQPPYASVFPGCKMVTINSLFLIELLGGYEQCVKMLRIALSPARVSCFVVEVKIMR